MKCDFLNDDMFKKLETDVHKSLDLHSKLKFDNYIRYDNPAEHVYMAISRLKENHPNALQCIGIICRGMIRIGSTSFVNSVSGKTGDQIVEMSLEGFLAFMNNLEY